MSQQSKSITANAMPAFDLVGCAMNRDQKNRPFRAMALYSAVLAQLAGSMIAGIFAGMALDKRLNTVPLFLIIGLLGGLSAGIYAMLRTIQHFNSGD